MSSFKILTHRPMLLNWKHKATTTFVVSSYGLVKCPEYVVFTWCRRRKKFRRRKTALAIGIPYDGWMRWGKLHYKRDDSDALDFGKELATQHGCVWIEDFDPTWSMEHLTLLRLKGVI